MKSPLLIDSLIVEYVVKDDLKRAVDGVSFDLKAGEIFGLLGPNGAGKTSIISAITNLLSGWKGTIEIFGNAVGSNDAKKMIGLVPQELVSYGFFSVWEILNFIAGYFGIKSPEDRINWLLDRLQLQEVRNKKVAQLSGGMKRRLLIAKSLLHSPRLLLLDEPSAGVDVELRQILWDFVKELNRDGVTILLTTHYLEEGEELCDRVAIIHHGKLLALDRTSRLVSSLGQRVISLTTTNPIALRSAYDSKKILELTQEGNRVDIRIPSDLPLSSLMDELKVSAADLIDLKPSEASLEDAFKKIIREVSHGR